MRLHLALAIAGALGLTACAQPTTPAAPKTEAAKAAGACGDGFDKLKTLGVCPAEAAKQLIMTDGGEPGLPEGCVWTVQESITEAGDEALIYRAASCKGVTTRFAVNRGAKSISYTYATSAVFGDSVKDNTPVMQLLAMSSDVKAEIKGQAMLIAEPADNIANCALRPAGIEGWPKDAMVLDLTTAAKRRAKVDDADGVRTACGMYGVNTGETSYWLAKQGDAWFFQLGQEETDFDPRSITFLRKTEAGAWEAAKAE
jgi:hypothetical protein